MKFRIVVILALSQCVTAWAQPSTLPSQPNAVTQQNAIDVRPISKVPRIVRLRVPRGGKSWFYGSAPIGAEGSAVMIHFYVVPTKRNPTSLTEKKCAKIRGYAFNPQDYVLDLFSESSTRQGKRRITHFKLLNSVQMSGAVFFQENLVAREFDHVDAHRLWLNPQQKSGPIVWLSCWVNSALNASRYQNDLLITFPGGLAKSSTAQDFDHTMDFAEDTQKDYTQVDEQGNMRILRRSQGSGAVGLFTVEHWA